MTNPPDDLDKREHADLQPIEAQIDDIPDEVVHAIEQRVVHQLRAEYFSGPLPPPAILEGYNELVNGGAERVFRQFEMQSEHRRSIESQVINSDVARSQQGLYMGGALALVFMLTAAYLILEGHDWAGTAIGGSTLVSIVSIFVIGTRSRNRELRGREQPEDTEDA